MSKLGKIFLWIALVGALVAVGAGVMLIQTYNGTKADLAQSQVAKAASDKAAAAAKKEALDAQQAATDANTKLTDTTKKVDDLTTQLATVQKSADDAKGALKQATDSAKEANDNLAKITAALDGKTPEQYKADVAKAQADAAAAQSEQKILQDQLQASQSQIADLKDAINRKSTGNMPPGISGKVTFVNRTWNFVVLNVGLSNGVVPNGELIVYHGRDFLGKVKVTSAEANSCVADILPESKGDIQVGDLVLN